MATDDLDSAKYMRREECMTRHAATDATLIRLDKGIDRLLWLQISNLLGVVGLLGGLVASVVVAAVAYYMLP